MTEVTTPRHTAENTAPPQTVKLTKTSNRKTYIEVMRIIAAFFVIVNHTNSNIFLKYSEPESPLWYLSLTYFFLSKIAVPVFLMIMGGLLLQKIDRPKKSFERVLRMVVVLLVTSVIYFLYLNRLQPDNITISNFLTTVFTKRTNNAMWYMYTYIGLLILLPILQRMAKALSKKATLYLLILSVGVMGTIPLLKVFFNFTLNSYFTETFFIPLVGIVFAGFYVEKYMKVNLKACLASCAIFVFVIAFEVLYTKYLYDLNPKSYLSLDNRENLLILSSAFCFYVIFKYISTVITTKEKLSKVICYFGSLTFGIYLLSDLVMFITKPLYLERVPESEHIFLLTVLWQVVIFVGCAIPTAILKLIPGIKKYI